MGGTRTFTFVEGRMVEIPPSVVAERELRSAGESLARAARALLDNFTFDNCKDLDEAIEHWNSATFRHPPTPEPR